MSIPCIHPIRRDHDFRARRTVALATAVMAGIGLGQARGQDLDVRQGMRPAAQVMTDALKDGAFLPLSMGTASTPHRSAALAWAGYASDRHRAVVDARAEAVLLPWLILQARTATDTESTGLRPSVGARIRLLAESGARPGVALGAFYKTEGFTEPEGELEGVLALSTHVRDLGLLANLVYGQDADGRERDAEAGAAATLSLRDRWLLGIDTRARINLVPSRAEQPGQPSLPRFDLVAGPLAMCRLGPTFLAAQVGMAMIELADLHVGPFALLGFGAAL
jgi:hypothetical protein